MRGYYAERLNGMCSVGATSCIPFPRISCHLMVGTKVLAAPIDEQTSLAGNVKIPQPRTHGLVGYPYATSGEGKLPGKLLPHYVASSSLTGWGTRTTTSFGYPTTFEGPALANVQCVVGLENRPVTDPWLYLNRKNAYFTDADPVNRRNFHDQYCGKDWLGFVWPGDFMHTPSGMPQPLQAEAYFEQSGSVTDLASQTPLEYNILEFDQHVPVYEDSAGTNLLGNYVGLTFIPIFGACAIKNPVGTLPTDPSVPYPPGALVSPSNQFVSLDLWIYLAAVAASGRTLTSPRIATMRGWLPKADIASASGLNASWCDRYQYITFKANDDHVNSFSPRLRFNLTGGGVAATRVVLSDFRAYVVA